MKNIIRSACIAAAAAAFALVAQSASAAPSSALMPSIGWTAAQSNNVETVQFRRGGFGRGRAIGMRGGRYGAYRGGYRRGGNFGRNAGIGLGAAIIGGVILSESARASHRSEHSSDWQRCEDTYRSFERSTGMYTGYDGIRRTCPYLN